MLTIAQARPAKLEETAFVAADITTTAGNFTIAEAVKNKLGNVNIVVQITSIQRELPLA